MARYFVVRNANGEFLSRLGLNSPLVWRNGDSHALTFDTQAQAESWIERAPSDRTARVEAR